MFLRQRTRLAENGDECWPPLDAGCSSFFEKPRHDLSAPHNGQEDTEK
jgi:hypothetical protein